MGLISLILSMTIFDDEYAFCAMSVLRRQGEATVRILHLLSMVILSPKACLIIPTYSLGKLEVLLAAATVPSDTIVAILNPTLRVAFHKSGIRFIATG